MRFFYALVAFVVAAVLISIGIAQKTFLAPPPTVQVGLSVSEKARYVVVSGSVFQMFEGKSVLHVPGGADVEEQVVAYGRTADVVSWLDTESYERVTYDEKAKDIKSEFVSFQDQKYKDQRAHDAVAPNPRGSDLWIDEYIGADSTETFSDYSETVSALVATDGTQLAPHNLSVSWPVDTNTRTSTLLIYIGSVFLLVGLLLYGWAIYRDWRMRGPMRESSRSGISRRRKRDNSLLNGRSYMSVLALVVVAVFGLAAPGSSFGEENQSFRGEPVKMEDPSPEATDFTPTNSDESNEFLSFVTKGQLSRIMKNVSEVTQQADAAADIEKAKIRFAGPALELRQANYHIRQTKPDEPPLDVIPADPIEMVLPQSSDQWPRAITLVVAKPDDAEGKSQVPMSLLLVQESPRENYRVQFAVSLEPNVVVNALSPAAVGAQAVSSESNQFELAPKEIGRAYGDVLLHGDQSEFYSKFDLTHDTLQSQIGVEWKNQRKALIPSTAELSFAYQERPGSEYAFATDDGGALVWVNIAETQTLRAKEAGAEVSAGPTATALSGIANSKTGIETTFSYQLVFYLPPAGQGQHIQLLGFAQGTVSAKEIQ